MTDMVGRRLTSADPEPPVGSVVDDDCGLTWENDGHRPCCWVRPDLREQGIHDPETWTKIAGNYGPVTIVQWGAVAPLDDPDYEPVHVPVRGRVPEVVKLWGKASQLRWFRRFRQELYQQIDALPPHERLKLSRHDDVDYWCESEHHKGRCCYSCFEEGEGGYDDHCCCRDERNR